MKVTEAEVKHIAKLARLKVTDEMVQKYVKDLGEISNFVEALNEVSTDGVLPTAHILDIKNVFRKDELVESYDRDTLFQNAPSFESGCISVPKVVE